jgi:DNA-binding transcriptional LysR family regulator
MTLSQLTAFLWVATLGSFRAAAEHLRLTQPTISLRIQTLEVQLATSLFERTGSRVRLTASGTLLLDYAQRILSLAGEATTRVGDKEGSRHRLRIGTVDSFALTCMPEILSKLTVEHPKTVIDITVGHTVLLQQKLIDGQLDIAVLGDAIPDDDLIETPLARLRMAWVTSSKLKLRSTTVRPEDFIELQILTMPSDSRIYHILQQWFVPSGSLPQRICTCSSLATIVALLKVGFGVSLLPRFCVAEELRRHVLKELHTTPPVPNGLYTVAQHKLKPYYNFDAIFKTMERVVKKRVR